jgi:hypothetical protein
MCVCVCVCSHRITSRFVFIIVFFSFLKFSITIYQCFQVLWRQIGKKTNLIIFILCRSIISLRFFGSFSSNKKNISFKKNPPSKKKKCSRLIMYRIYKKKGGFRPPSSSLNPPPSAVIFFPQERPKIGWK